MENEKEGFPVTALSGIRILQLLNHENIVKLLEICPQYTRHKTKHVRPRVLLARPGRPPEQHQRQVQLRRDQEGIAADL